MHIEERILWLLIAYGAVVYALAVVGVVCLIGKLL